MPFKRAVQTDRAEDETTETQTRYAFRFRAYWFVLAQTDGEGVYGSPLPGFDIDTALRILNITCAPFDEDGIHGPSKRATSYPCGHEHFNGEVFLCRAHAAPENPNENTELAEWFRRVMG
jgi:hypothetical protein